MPMPDDDIMAALPHPPPPSPKRREAAIGDAMARFGGAGQAAPDRAAQPAARPTGWWANIRRPQATALVTAALVAAIGLPVAWTIDFRPDAPAEQATPAPRDAAPPATAEAAARTDTPTTPSPPPAVARAVSTSTAAPEAGTAPAPHPAEPARLAPPAPPPPPPSPMVAGRTARSDGELVVSGARVARPALEQASPVTAFSAEEAPRDEAGSIVVTGAMIAPRGKPARGDWNACTVNDPSQTLTRCRKMANKGTKDVQSRADAHLADGLKQAWAGNFDEAIAAFDRAIAVAPDLSVAYLNRGIAYERQGDRARAIADLDQAVKYAPKSARAYYNRSLILRENGDLRRADADESRAINLDPRYQKILR